MKLLSALALTALLGSTAAFAQSSATTTTNPNASGTSATTTENSTSSSASTTTESHHSLKKMCHKQAKEKNLTGADKKQYLKDCEAGKTSG